MRPLDGVTVVALEQAVAAPFATRQLADYGARVIKVERPEGGDFARHYDETVQGLSSHFVWINRGKESLTLNLKTSQGMDVLGALLARADVLVANLRPGALEKLGLEREYLSRAHPHLISCHISGYGGDGPYRDRKAYDLLIQAESGLLSITGTPETPSKVGLSIADIAAGMYALTGILTALYQRTETRRGTHIEVSMLEALTEWMGYPLNFGHFSGVFPARSGAHHATIAPYGPYRVLGGDEVFLGEQIERDWQAFCRLVLQSEALSRDQRFHTNSRRVSHREALNAEIERVISGISMEEAQGRLERAGIAYGELNAIEKVWQHPQLRARKRFREVKTEVGPVEALLPPITFSEVSPRMGEVPGLGAQTDAILQELGWSPAAIQRLRTEGVI